MLAQEDGAEHILRGLAELVHLRGRPGLVEDGPEAAVEEGGEGLRILDVEVAGPGALGKEAGEGIADGPLRIGGGEALGPVADERCRGAVADLEIDHGGDKVAESLGAVFAFERRLDIPKQFGSKPLAERLQRGVLAVEVEVEGALGDACPAGYLVDCGRPDASQEEDGLRRVENLATAIVGLHVTSGQCSLASLMTEGFRRLVVVPGHPVETLAWVRPDLLQRLLPFAAVTLLVGLAWRPRWLGLSVGDGNVQLLFGLVGGVAMFIFALPLQLFLSRRRGAIRVPDAADAALQGGYYVLNAACEEGFFRGVVQGSLSVLAGMPLAFLAATAAYVFYHRLGRWAWADVFATALVGVPLGLAFWLLPGPPSLLGVTLAHVGATCGFLGPGPYVLRRLRLV